MKKSMIALVGVMMIGGLSACSGLPASLGGVSNQLESIIAVTVAGTYTVMVIKEDQTIFVETWECTQNAGKLTGCHKIDAKSADPAIPVK